MGRIPAKDNGHRPADGQEFWMAFSNTRASGRTAQRSVSKPNNLADGADVPAAKPDQRIHDFFEQRARAGDGAFAIAYALLNLTDAQIATARALNKLGVSDASTPFGAMENLAMELKRAGESVSGAVSEVGTAIAESMSSSTDDSVL